MKSGTAEESITRVRKNCFDWGSEKRSVDEKACRGRINESHGPLGQGLLEGKKRVNPTEEKSGLTTSPAPTREPAEEKKAVKRKWISPKNQKVSRGFT